MTIDAEAIMAEYNRQVTDLSQRCATSAGTISALYKRIAELEAENAALKKAPQGGT